MLPCSLSPLLLESDVCSRGTSSAHVHTFTIKDKPSPDSYLPLCVAFSYFPSFRCLLFPSLAPLHSSLFFIVMKINRRLPSLTTSWVVSLIVSLSLLPQGYAAAEAALEPGSSLRDRFLLPVPMPGPRAGADQVAGATFENSKNNPEDSTFGGNQVIKIGSNIPLPPVPENF